MFFTAGDSAITEVTPKTIEVGGVYYSETKLICKTPNFAKFGACNAVVQVKISDGVLTTSSAPFSFELNTSPYMSLCYGPGIEDVCSVGAPAEFIFYYPS